MTSSTSKLTGLRNLSAALTIAVLVIAGEYFFRHYVLFWLPTIGELAVNDMLSLFLVYLLLTVSLGLIMHTDWRQELSGVVQSLREGLTSWNFTLWVVALVFCVYVLSTIDRLLWGSIQLPMFVSIYRNPAVWLTPLAPVLKVVSLVLVNGLFVPIAEEYLWRGLVQDRLLRILPVPIAIGLTALLFSLKHVLVDASLGRFLALIAFGVICGVVAQRSTWSRSAALHIIINTAATIVGLISGMN